MYHEVNLKAIHCNEPSKNKKGSQVVYLRKDDVGDDPVGFQLNTDEDAPIKAPFGPTQFEDKPDAWRRSLELSLTDKNLIEWAGKFDKALLGLALKNAGKWWKGKKTAKDIEMMYRPVLAIDEEGKYPPRLHAKVTVKGDYKTKVWVGHEGGQYSDGTVDDIRRGSYFTVVTVEAMGFWFQPKQFGVTLVVTAVLTAPAQSSKGIEGFVFRGARPKRVEGVPELAPELAPENLSSSLLLNSDPPRNEPAVVMVNALAPPNHEQFPPAEPRTKKQRR